MSERQKKEGPQGEEALIDSPWSYRRNCGIGRCSETLLSTPEVPTASGLSSLVELAYCHCSLEGARDTPYSGSYHPLPLGCPIYPPFPTAHTDRRPDGQGPFLGLRLWTESPMLIEMTLKAGIAAVETEVLHPTLCLSFPMYLNYLLASLSVL